MYLASSGGTCESDNLRHEPKRSMARIKVMKRVCSVASVNGILDDELSAQFPADSDDGGRARDEGIGLGELATVGSGYIRRTSRVVAVAHWRWALFPVG
jgi:hypothetical protein